MSRLNPAALALFNTQTVEADFRAKTGYALAQLPFDRTWPVQRWFDPSANPHSSQPKTYRVAGQMSFEDMTIPESRAAVPNIPPTAIVYPQPVPDASPATRGGSGFNPIYLSMEADARELMALIGGTDLNVEELPGFSVEYNGEPRRLWSFMFGGKPRNAGALLFYRDTFGVGRGGNWGTDPATGDPVWNPEPNETVQVVGPELRVPCKPLSATQTEVKTLFGFEVEDTSDEPQKAGTDGGGNLQLLTQIAKDLQAIKTFLRLP